MADDVKARQETARVLFALMGSSLCVECLVPKTGLDSLTVRRVLRDIGRVFGVESRLPCQMCQTHVEVYGVNPVVEESR